MPDRVTVTRHQGFFSRLTESIKAILFGAILFVLAFPVLFWNEGRAVRTARSLDEGAGVVASVNAESVSPQNDGKLVHVSAFAKTDDVLEDATFGVSASAVKLIRSVEMYQWVEDESSETETNLGGSQDTTTTYSYDKQWRPSLVDSDAFQSPDGHRNPKAFPFESQTLTASRVTLGAYDLSVSQVDRLRKSESLRLTELRSAPAETAKLHEGVVYIGDNPTNPSVGDVRVAFSVVRPGPVSVVARQVGSTFEPYSAKAGGSVFLLEESIASADAMFASAQASNTVLTWILRGVGFFMMFLGLATIFRPLAVMGDVVPAFGALLGAGVGLVSALFAAFFSFVTIGIAWIVYRPLIGLILLGLAVGAVVLLVRAKKSAAPAVPPLPPLPTG